MDVFRATLQAAGEDTGIVFLLFLLARRWAQIVPSHALFGFSSCLRVARISSIKIAIGQRNAKLQVGALGAQDDEWRVPETGTTDKSIDQEFEAFQARVFRRDTWV